MLVSDLTSIELVGGESWYNYIWSNIENFSSAYELLEDDKSKKLFAALLNYRMSRDVSYLNGLVDELDTQYFDSALFDINNVSFADCGAFTGDTIENFIKLTNGQYKRIYAFEPDNEIFRRLEKNVKDNRWSNVLAYNVGTYSKKAQLQFASVKDGTDMAGHISEQGNVIINVDALDNIILDDIGLIKMDIEGAEYDALLGCKRLIQKFKPILAICIYHRRDDYYKLINLVHSMHPDYKLYVRQYAYNDNETVLYAV